MELQGSRDLGELALSDPEERHTVHLLVQAEDGAPIPSAVAGTDSDSPISEPTDEAGRTSLTGVIPGKSTIHVFAAGWEVKSVDTPARLPAELVVTLRRGATLEVRFRTPDGGLAFGLTARFWATQDPYRVTQSSLYSLYGAYKAAGCTMPIAILSENGMVVARLHAGKDGRVLLNDLRPGLPLSLRVEGLYGTPVHKQDIGPLSPEEWRVLDVELPRGPRTLHGRVVDEIGRPLLTARPSVSFAPADSPGGLTFGSSGGVDENGEFEVTRIFASHISLTISAPKDYPFLDGRVRPGFRSPRRSRLPTARGR